MQCIETSKNCGSIRVMFGTLTACEAFRRPSAGLPPCASARHSATFLWWLTSLLRPLSSRSSASFSVAPHLSLHRWHPPFLHRCRRSHCRGRSQILPLPQIQTQSGNPRQRSRRPRRHYRDSRHLHRHWRQGRRLGERLQEWLLTIDCVSTVRWVQS